MRIVGKVNKYYESQLSHSGIKGQKWGIRRWQYKDGSLTPEGYPHYGYNGPRTKLGQAIHDRKEAKAQKKEMAKQQRLKEKQEIEDDANKKIMKMESVLAQASKDAGFKKVMQDLPKDYFKTWYEEDGGFEEFDGDEQAALDAYNHDKSIFEKYYELETSNFDFAESLLRQAVGRSNYNGDFYDVSGDSSIAAVEADQKLSKYSDLEDNYNPNKYMEKDEQIRQKYIPSSDEIWNTYSSNQSNKKVTTPKGQQVTYGENENGKYREVTNGSYSVKYYY